MTEVDYWTGRAWALVAGDGNLFENIEGLPMLLGTRKEARKVQDGRDGLPPDLRVVRVVVTIRPSHP
jgi:hypothetical protein